MPTTSFAFTDSHILETGPFSNFFAYRQFGGVNAQVDFIATGTALTMAYQGGGLQLIVDGVSSTPAMTDDGADHVLTIFTGLTEGDHRVTIKRVTNAGIFAANAATTCFSLTGAAPAFKAANTAFTGQPDLSGTSYALYGQSGIDVNQGLATSGFSANQYHASWPDACIRFRASPAGAWKIHGFSGQSGRTLVVTVDGVAKTPVVQVVSGNWEYNTLATGTGDGAEHEFGVWFADTQPSNDAYIYSLHLLGMTLNAAYSWPARSTYAYFGDSITECIIGTGNDSLLGWPWLLSAYKNVYDANRGRGGTYLSASLGGGNSAESQTALITGLNPQPTELLMMYGANDASASCNPATFQTSFTNTLNSLLSGTTYRITVLGITDNVSAQSQDNALNAVIPAAIAACSTPSRVRFVSTAGVVSGGNFITGGHPNGAGNIELFNLIKPLFTVSVGARNRRLTLNSRRVA